MYHRKVLLVALLAVVLLGSFLGGGVELLKCHRCKRHAEISLRHRIKPRNQVTAVMPVFDPTTYQASLKRWVNKVAGWTLGTDPNALQETAPEHKPRRGGHKPRTAMDATGPFKIAGWAKTLDNTGRIQG